MKKYLYVTSFNYLQTLLNYQTTKIIAVLVSLHLILFVLQSTTTQQAVLDKKIFFRCASISSSDDRYRDEQIFEKGSEQIFKYIFKKN